MEACIIAIESDIEDYCRETDLWSLRVIDSEILTRPQFRFLTLV